MAPTLRMDQKEEHKQGPRWKSTLPTLFIATTVLQLALYQWPRRWLMSGAPVLTFFLLQGEAHGHRVLPFAHLWPLLATINLTYAIASTSWLLYWIFVALCYPTIFLTCLFRFRIVGILTRQTMRALLKQLHFIDEKIALFNIPALEIDTEVDGLMVIRGITFSLPTLRFVVHGVEVGIKLSDDMELAIQTEKVIISLFRKIEVGDCFANLKGGDYEMTFGHIEGKTKNEDGDAMFVVDTPPFLKAASRSQPELVKMKSEMTDGSPPEDSSPKTAIKKVERHSLYDDPAYGKYQQMLEQIESTSTIHQSQMHIEQLTETFGHSRNTVDSNDKDALRAAICSQLHSKASVPHPPKRSIKVTTLQNLSSPPMKRFMHRLPMLLRLLLNPISYFHPVKISSITATASGSWIEAMLVQKIFKEYGNSDSELQRLKNRISDWVSGANFAIELGNISGTAQVPFISSYDINCRLVCENVMAYRSLPEEGGLNEVVRVGGADASFVVPTFLLPHHEHLIPALPTREAKQSLKARSESVGGKPKEIQRQHHLRQEVKDEANVKVSVHASLPVTFDQELLNFIAVLIKACKLIEVEEAADPMDEEVHRKGESTGGLNQRVKDKVKKVMLTNDKWLARLVGTVMRKMEHARGDFGYSGDIPVKLATYRETGWYEKEGQKLLH